ncbi:PQQ-binding-like beta-propeller repeat protein [Planosporangium sp. 12N6]|uniref:outer membrane protein assembly factor BamB family protein n=1 Tax=Planosporangium spinosum TaxID=3402278 RepID=UPI003CF2171C
MRWALAARLAAAVSLLLVSGCADPAPDPADWTTYHHDNGRSGVAVGLAPLGTLTRAWVARLDGAVYGQPLAVGNRIFAATENDTVYALAADSGRVLWSTHVGTPVPLAQLPCGNIDPLGITSTMVYDPRTALLFALAETGGGRHVLVSVDAATGAVRERRAAEPPTGDRIAHQQRAALNLVGGRVYIAYGGLAGDCANYVGAVVALPTTGATRPLSYHIPTRREGGIWAPGGATVVGDRLMYAVGNGESTTGYDGSDSVIALNRDLELVDRFTPSSWPQDNSSDADLGSMTPAAAGGYVYADGKRGVGYTVRPDRLGGIGGQVAQAPVCPAYGGAAVSGNTVYVPCQDGPRAVTIGADGGITVGWRAEMSGGGSPVVGGGAVWVVDTGMGSLTALDPATGAVRQRLPVGDVSHFASPTLAHNRAYVPTLTGVVAVAGA